MDIDDPNHWDPSDNSDNESALDSSDNFLIHEAASKQLLRLRKEQLVELYVAAGLSEDAELLTKPEIVDCIIAARDDVAELPPSSPGVADSNSSDYSSDGGNVAGGEETDFVGRFKNGLRRRVTVQDFSRASRVRTTERCLSLGQLDHQRGDTSKKVRLESVGLPQVNGLSRKRGPSNASSVKSPPVSSVAASSLPSPPATRLRSRKASNEPPVAPASSETWKGKGKGKQVEFSDDIQISDANTLPSLSDEESDLTDLTEIEASIKATASPSPRRLRSKGDKGKIASQKDKQRVEGDCAEAARRVIPMRKAKENVGSLREDDDEEDELEESDRDQEGEVDELASPSPTATPKASAKRTPVRRRLRSRRLQTHTPPSDGDDEGSDGELHSRQSVEENEEENEGDDERSVADNEDEDAHLILPPRRLRSGKIVTEDDTESIGDEDEENESIGEDVDVEVDLEDETEGSEETDEPMDDDDVDLAIATTKSLVRLRRDDLVRLCETRDLDATGTKPQLAEALLQWRDRHYSSPSSTGTARPPSTTKGRPNGRRKTRSNSGSGTPPVLLREERVHMDEPRTPPPSGRQKEPDPELELDLESLGLDDREIPPDKLTKLEKIGSGGFKDVFIAKFKGRKVAIAEFRDQLSAMDIKELKLLGDFSHPNIVRFLGVSIPENTRETPVMIVSELCSNGDLFDYVRNVNPPSLYRVLCIMLDIARGLEYLHTRKPSVIHRDCKSSNILITSRGVAKITDFGLAKVKQSTRSMVRSLVGTVNWQAPELWHAHPKYNHKVDVFSCALVYWEILQWHVPNKKFPWEGMNEHAIYDLVGSKRQRPSVSGLRKHWCPEIVDLMDRMWQHDHQERPTMSEVVEEVERLVQKYR
ncbi:uncharacterized protein FIBRA_02551 [Fibroporia radiculosa]|uniref:Protein kinase domain-containing protein n=1 Tax=Fibroporia radiculosa TaxID=599839 RepID=J4HV44_9APHY|nr:uncharacterized protein FIBRA_02551 [Fibroporia radiculosa]CCM00517.1 predicted protein [Fibroporia radiculosa]